MSEELDDDQAPPLSTEEVPVYQTWAELSQVVKVQGTALEFLGKQTREMAEKLRLNEKKLDFLTRNMEKPIGPGKD